MLPNSEKFQQFAITQLKSAAFTTSYEEDSSHLFHTSLDSTIHLLKWTLKTKNKNGEPFQYLPGFADIYEPNAFADRYQNDYYIGLYTAMFVSVSEFAMFCFAQEDFFSEMGDSSKENSPAPWDHRVPGLWLIDFTKHGGHVDNKHSRTLIPKDPERYQLSTCLTFLMVRFIWLHELSHCLNGHVALVQNNNIALRLYEVTPMQVADFKTSNHQQMEDAEVQKILRHLEYDADQSAFLGGINIQLGDLENLQALINLPYEQRIKLTLFASYVMPWLFEQYQDYYGINHQETHPEPIERLEYVFETAKERVLSQHPELGNINKEVLRQFDTIRKKIPSLYNTEKLVDLFNNASMKNRYADFEVFHNDLLQRLQPFQYSEKY